MQVITTKSAMRQTVRTWRLSGETVSLTPTSGNLHAGPMALVERARQEGGRIVVSILHKPAQGGSTGGSDDAGRDLAVLRDAGVDGVFLPEVAEFHPPDAQSIVETLELAKILTGKLRPGHFRRVATDAARLFNIIQPDAAFFGEKDYQQLCVIRQMVRDLDIPVRIIGVQTVRDSDGLAMSSRNTRLSPEDRAAAAILSRALSQAEEMAKTGITASRLRAWVAAHIQAEPRADLQLADIRDALTLQPIAGPLAAPAVILLAARFGQVQLIDHRVVTP